MRDINITYKDDIILELPSGGACYLATANKYCEEDIKIEYTPSHKTYNLEFSNTRVNGSDIVLVTLDDEVLAHINDETFTAHLVRTNLTTMTSSSIVYEMFATNRPLAYHSGTAIYGTVARGASSQNPVARPANGTTTSNGNSGTFRVNGNKFCYYYYGSSGNSFGFDGNYILTLLW